MLFAPIFWANETLYLKKKSIAQLLGYKDVQSSVSDKPQSCESIRMKYEIPKHEIWKLYHVNLIYLKQSDNQILTVMDHIYNLSRLKISLKIMC